MKHSEMDTLSPNMREMIKSRKAPGLTGTRDSFGIGKEFVDHDSGKVIDNWKSWEKAGYKDVSMIQNPDHKKRVKDEMKRDKYKNQKWVKKMPT